jgi:transcriptional regulator with XRE-family HTH domain
MEEQQRLEIASRIKELRERGPYKQPQIAEKLGIGLRAYQKVEKNGTTEFERCEEIAKIHKAWTSRDPDWGHVSASWIWDGRLPKAKGERTPLDALSKSGGQGAILAAVAALREELDAARIELLAEIGKVQETQAAPQSQTGISAKRSKSTRK